jgi:hypothetical protein
MAAIQDKHSDRKSIASRRNSLIDKFKEDP